MTALQIHGTEATVIASLAVVVFFQALALVTQQLLIRSLRATIAVQSHPRLTDHELQSTLSVSGQRCIITDITHEYRGLSHVVTFTGVDLETYQRERNAEIVKDWAVDPRGGPPPMPPGDDPRAGRPMKPLL